MEITNYELMGVLRTESPLRFAYLPILQLKGRSPALKL
jgi:hypothetical protein